jgi:hypothetical protein
MRIVCGIRLLRLLQLLSILFEYLVLSVEVFSEARDAMNFFNRRAARVLCLVPQLPTGIICALLGSRQQ